MAVLGKANFHTADIWRLKKNQLCKKDQGEITDSNFNFF